MTDLPDQTPSYTHRPRPLGPGTTLELDPDALCVTTGLRTTRIPYGEIGSIRLAFAPANMARKAWAATLRTRGGRSVTITSRNWKSMAELELRNAAYRRFLGQLCERLPSAELLAGASAPRYWLVAGVTAVVTVALAALVLWVLGSHLLATPERPARTPVAAALFALALLAYLLWWAGDWLRRNRPALFTLDAPPERVLPPA